LRQRVIVRGAGVTGLDTVQDLVGTQWHQKICMANPAFGTTSGHLAALFVLWGPERGEGFLRALRANEVRLLGGNSEVVKQVALGQYAAGLTDNDDVDAAIREGAKVTAVPAKLRDGTPTLAVPCTVGLVAGARHEPEAKQLIDYLLSAEVEGKLRAAKFAVAGSTHGESAVGMRVDFREAARMMPRAVEAARRILEGRE
jgi:iron(III) transport system substrate-binding protein